MYRALLVDDETPDLEGLKTLVDWKSFDIEAAWATTSPIEALAIIEREAVDLLVSDVRMPRMTGLDLYARGKEHLPDLAAVFISGHADFSYAKRAIDESAVAYILKPVDDAELAAALRHVVQRLGRIARRTELPIEKEQVAKGEHTRDRLVIRELKRAVEEDLEKGISLKELAARFGMTPNHLGFVFRESESEFFSDYLTRRRLDRARILLKDPQLKVYEVAYRLGYRNTSHFNRIFKEHYGVTPGEFRDALPSE
jgi:two-component system, response regulator YesN